MRHLTLTIIVLSFTVPFSALTSNARHGGWMLSRVSTTLEESEEGGMGGGQLTSVQVYGKAIRTVATIPGAIPAVPCTTTLWQSPTRWGGIPWGYFAECRRNGAANAAEVRFSNTDNSWRSGWLAITGQSTTDVANGSHQWQVNPTVGSIVWTTPKTDMWNIWRGQYPVWAAGANQPYVLNGNRLYMDCLVTVAHNTDGIIPVAQNIFREDPGGMYRYSGPPAGVPPAVPMVEHWEPNNGASGTQFPRWDCIPGTVANPNPNNVYIAQFLVLAPPGPASDLDRVIAGVMIDVPSITAFYTDLVGAQQVWQGHADPGGMLVAGDRVEFQVRFTTVVRVCNTGGGTPSHYFFRVHWGPGVVQTVGTLAPAPSTTATGMHVAASALSVGEPPLQTIVDLYNATNANGRCHLGRSTLEATNPGDRVRYVP